uniref:Fiber protein Fb11 n=1 Tax=Salix viminalis TaxID=40686 RepID=A0A6N2KZ13_SALVM
MPVMEKLRMFIAQEPVVAASCLIGGIGLFLPAVVRPILDSLEGSKHVPEKHPSISACRYDREKAGMNLFLKQVAEFQMFPQPDVSLIFFPVPSGVK